MEEDLNGGGGVGGVVHGGARPNMRRIPLTVIVHVIEARDLIGKDSSQMSDPFVRVSVAGIRKQTDIKYGALSCTWDQVFTFQEVNLTMDEYEREDIHIECLDANTFFRNELIGRFAFSLLTVRGQKNPPHQLYRQWIVLGNPESPNEPQGYLRITVTVLGPGDTPPTHSHDAEQLILNGALANDNDKGEKKSRLGVPDVGMRRGYNFAIKVYRGEQFTGLTIGGSLDPFIVVKFNGQVERTAVRRQTLSPDWNYMLVLPIHTPVLSEVVEIQLWHSNWASPDQHIATTRIRFSSILAEYIPPTWFNFYGLSPEENSFFGWIAESVRSQKIEPTTYLGRVLMSLSATLVSAPVHEVRACAPVKGPVTEKYLLWVDIYEITEIAASLGFGGRVMVELQFGYQNERKSDWCAPTQFGETEFDSKVRMLCTDERYKATRDPDSDKICVFKEISALLPHMDPGAPSRVAAQLPNIILNIYVSGLLSGQTKIGHVKIRAMDVWGFRNEPEWHAIEGYVSKATGFTKSEGFVLIGACFGPKSELKKISNRHQIRGLSQFPLNLVSVPSGPDHTPSSASNEGVAYQLRAHVYQARNLVSTDDSGLISPFVKVSLGGNSAHLVCTQPARYKEWSIGRAEAKDGKLRRTSVVENSRNPVWYETLLIPEIRLPQKLSLSPDIEIKVFDSRQNSDYIGKTYFPCDLATGKFSSRKSRPRWLRLAKHDFAAQRYDNTLLSNTTTEFIHSSNTGHTGPTNVTASSGAHSSLASALPPGEYNPGDILIKLELVPLFLRDGGRAVGRGATAANIRGIEEPKKKRRERWHPWYEHPWPEVEKCDLRIACVGLRRLIPLEYGPEADPFIEISVPSVPDMRLFLKHVAKEALPTGAAQKQQALIVKQTNENEDDEDENEDDEDEDEDDDDEDEIRPERASLSSKGTQKLEEERLVTQKFLDLDESTLNLLLHDVNVDLNSGIATWSNGDFEEENVEDDDTEAAMEDKTKAITPETKEDSLHDVLGRSLSITESGSSFMHQPIPGTKGFALSSWIKLVVNLPKVPVFCQSAVLRVFERKLYHPPTEHTWTSGDSNTNAVIASAVIPLREFAQELYGTFTTVQKDVDEIFKMPRFVMTREGQEHVEALARKDSELTQDSIFTVATEGGGGEEKDNRADSLEQKSNEFEELNENDDGNKIAVNIPLDEEDDDSFRESENEDDTWLEISPLNGEGFDNLPKMIVLEMNEINFRFDNEVDTFPEAPQETLLATTTKIDGSPDANGDTGGTGAEEEKTETKEEAKENETLEIKQLPSKAPKIKRKLSDHDDNQNLATWPGNMMSDELRRLRAMGAVEGMLEESRFMQPYPYRIFQLHRGSLLLGNKIESGVFKAALKITRHEIAGDADKRARMELPFKEIFGSPLPEIQDLKLKNSLEDVPAIVRLRRRPQNVKVRVYIVQATDLASQSGANESTRPYVVININLPLAAQNAIYSGGIGHLGNALNGVTSINDVSNPKEGLNPFFGSWYELDATFPGASDLEVQIWDSGVVGNDLIGSTKIDLEDRWYNPRWQQMKCNGKIAREFRPLWKQVPGASSLLSRGKIELWVEIYSQREAFEAPVADIRLPENEEWEIRLVVWGTQKVPPLEGYDSLHMYITSELTYEKMSGEWITQNHETDVHRFIRDGAGNFNWRMKFAIMAPCKFPRLKLMAWNQDFLSSSSMIGEAVMDLQWLLDILRGQVGDAPIERPRTSLHITHANWPGLDRGEVDIQLSVLRKMIADKDPVGNAREPPNKDPFLPEPYRESWWPSLLGGGGIWRTMCCCLIILIPVIVILVLALK